MKPHTPFWNIPKASFFAFMNTKMVQNKEKNREFAEESAAFIRLVRIRETESGIYPT